MVKRSLASLLSLILFSATLALAGTSEKNASLTSGRQVLLISVDGLHALDVARYIESHPGSALAELSRHGITYSNANTPRNSDSFPGLLALVTGGSPLTHGLFYDVSYDRTIFDPTNTTCAGSPGNMMVFDESIDVYVGNVSQNRIDTTKLPRHIDAHGNCVPLFPHSALRTNTIFEVVRAAGGVTAWADKHPAYDLVNGPSGHGVDDLFTPEITNVGGLDNTHSVVCTVENDQKKVQAIINQINGLNHDGTKVLGVPAVFGMNFQGVSVGQKLSVDNFDNSCVDDSDPTINQQPGGYVDGSGTPSAVLAYALQKTDTALGSMITALKNKGLFDSTLFIVTAKHGQSPINPVKINKPGHFADLVAALPDGGTNAAAKAIVSANACGTGACGFVNDDDIALIWLADQTLDKQAQDYINTNANALFVSEVMGGDELKLKFGNPLKDSRTPDILVQPEYGTIYTKSTAKNAEHGGFAYSDTNVGLIVSTPATKSETIKSPVATSQVAATILQFLGLDPQALISVRLEKTEPLPQ